MTLLYLLISSGNFNIDFLTCTVIFPEKKRVLLFPSNQCDFFSCLIALSRTFFIMLNKTCDSGHPCLLPDLRGEHSVIYHFVDVSRIFFIDALYQVEEISFYFVFWEFVLWTGFEFCQMLFFFCIFWHDYIISLVFW